MDAVIQSQNPPKPERGVTLVESMVALLVFLIAAVGWISLEANLARTYGQSRATAQAVFVGQSKIDQMRLWEYEDLVNSPEPERYAADGFLDAEGTFYVTWNVQETIVDGSASRRRVEVVVTWNMDNEFQEKVQLYFTRSE